MTRTFLRWRPYRVFSLHVEFIQRGPGVPSRAGTGSLRRVASRGSADPRDHIVVYATKRRMLSSIPSAGLVPLVSSGIRYASLHVSKGDDLSQNRQEHPPLRFILRQEPVGGPGEFSVRAELLTCRCTHVAPRCLNFRRYRDSLRRIRS
jgi:hypothetical protein